MTTTFDLSDKARSALQRIQDRNAQRCQHILQGQDTDWRTQLRGRSRARSLLKPDPDADPVGGAAPSNSHHPKPDQPAVSRSHGSE